MTPEEALEHPWISGMPAALTATTVTSVAAPQTHPSAPTSAPTTNNVVAECATGQQYIVGEQTRCNKGTLTVRYWGAYSCRHKPYAAHALAALYEI